MRRVEYKITREVEPFTVASYALYGPSETAKDCPPIQMAITRCWGEDAKDINIVQAASLNFVTAGNFARHFPDILMGQSEDWKLVQVQLEAGHVDLEYYCPAINSFENIKVDVNGSPVKVLHLEFKVPHRDGRPDTEYRVYMDYSTSVRDTPPYSTTTITEILPSRRRTLFQLTSNEPDEITVTEYVDL